MEITDNRARQKKHRQHMEILVLWAIASGKTRLRDFAPLFGLKAWSSILTQYIRPLEAKGLATRDRLSTGQAASRSLCLTPQGKRFLSQYAILVGKGGFEVYEVVARYGDGGESEDYA